MAERRMISKSISVSEKVNSMSIFARLLYTWMIPHTDDWGRMTGSPAKVKGLVMPLEENVKRVDFEAALQEMNEAKVIRWYEVDGEMYVQIENFESHQQGLHKRTKSKFPEPPEPQGGPRESIGNSDCRSTIPGISGNVQNFPPELNRTELNRTELKKDIPPVSPKGEQLQPEPIDPVQESKKKKAESEKVKYAEYVYLTPAEYQKLTDTLGEVERDNYFLKFAAWISGKPVKEQQRRSAYLTILAWYRDEPKRVKPQTRDARTTSGKPHMPMAGGLGGGKPVDRAAWERGMNAARQLDRLPPLTKSELEEAWNRRRDTG